VTEPSLPNLRISQVFAALFLAVGGLLALLFVLLSASSRDAVLAVSDRIRADVSERATERVGTWLGSAQSALDGVDDALRTGVVDPDDPDRVEGLLFSELLANPELGELTFTRASWVGYHEDGNPALRASEEWQVSVVRVRDGDGWRIDTIRTVQAVSDEPATPFVHPRTFLRAVRTRPVDGGLRSGELGPAIAAEDPTFHPTFLVPASEPLMADTTGPGHALWTDLHYAEADADLPVDQRRVVVAAMKRVLAPQPVGVVRASLAATHLDELIRSTNAADPHQSFLVDDQGRFVSRLAMGDPLVEEPDDSLRAHPAQLPASIAAALALSSPTGRVTADGRVFLVSFADLPRTQGWRLGVVVPEDAYTADLARARNRVLLAAVAIMVAILVAGGLALRAILGGLDTIAASAGRVRGFDFAPDPARGAFREFGDVIESLERSKTALRAMGLYVPMDLVRRLYATNAEPTLGGEPEDVTMMFTDIVGFTSISEKVTANELAALLGRYLAVMATAIQAEQGTIDKYIGDAVMALWNVPAKVDQPAIRACRAALACVAAIERLHASPEWAGRPAMHTRFGLHTDRVLVGHFGAPDRMSYTVLGDGVNLASRLEGLNKQYGTTILASEVVEAAARGAFAFRALDVVAVKGKTRPIRVYELLGPPGSETPATQAYERAFAAYLARDFAGAIAALDPTDPPSARLAERCRELLASPPPADWDGVYVAKSK
jgi:adenylate cyclase